MTYEHERWITHLIEHRLATEGYNPNEETRAIDELKEAYVKAKLWDNIYHMTTDKAILSKIFDDEMYKLIHQTDKTDATIILEIIQLFLDRLERN